MKQVARRLAYDVGALGAIHARRNRRRLTVVMFHRVLPDNDPRWSSADPEYSMVASLFDACLGFFARHYSVVDAAAVAAAAKGASLPPCPLLITFDDGWADNANVALPLLRRHGMPATVFIATDAVDNPAAIWWHDLVVHAWNTGLVWGPELDRLRAACGLEEAGRNGGEAAAGLFKLLSQLDRLAAAERAKLLQPIAARAMFAPPRQMLDVGTIKLLQAGGMAVGAHGASHLPLTMIAEPEADVRRACARLGELTGTSVRMLSFPHGRYHQALVDRLRCNGLDLLFTSDQALNPCGRGLSGLMGRIEMPAKQVVDTAGRFAASRLATWLFFRPDLLPHPAAKS